MNQKNESNESTEKLQILLDDIIIPIPVKMRILKDFQGKKRAWVLNAIQWNILEVIAANSNIKVSELINHILIKHPEIKNKHTLLRDFVMNWLYHYY